jgi:segregation and condensation protein A
VTLVDVTPDSRKPDSRAPDSRDGRSVPADAVVNPDDGRFRVRLSNFEGPFDLLLQLISQHEMDVTEVALHQVTDDFIAHIHRAGAEWDLDETTEFLVVAATLLDLKAARLLPAADVEDVEDLALLEARDLLFARLLQYRAYKQVAALFGELEATALRRYPRSVALEDRYTKLLPEVLIGVDAAKFAEIAAVAFRPKPPPVVSLDHLHVAKVSVREHAALLRLRLAEIGSATFAELVEDCGHTMEVVARFLALLELYRQQTILFNQEDPLGELHVRWTGGSAQEAQATAVDADTAEDEEYG